MDDPLAGLRIDLGTCYVGEPSPRGNGCVLSPPYHSTWYILVGGVQVRGGGSAWRAVAGEGLSLPAGWRRLQTFAPGTRIVSLGLSLTWAAGMDVLDQAAPVRFAAAAAAPLAAAARAAVEAPADGLAAALARRAARDRYLSLWLAAMQAAGVALRPPAAGDLRLQRLAAELERAAGLGPLDWEGLRRATGLSRPQLDRLCRGAWGVPVRGLRDRLLLARARALLADPGRGLAAIAAELGAVDASHFGKWFRRCTGATPGEARRQVRGPDATASPR